MAQATAAGTGRLKVGDAEGEDGDGETQTQFNHRLEGHRGPARPSPPQAAKEEVTATERSLRRLLYPVPGIRES